MSGPTGGRTATTADLPVLDDGVLGELGLLDEGMGDLLAELVGAFVDVTDGQLRELRTSATSGDSAGLRRLAHTVKGSGGQLGGVALAAACTRLEQRCDAEELDRAADTVDEVEAAYGALVHELRALVAAVAG